MSPYGVLSWTEGYRTVLEGMDGYVNWPSYLRKARVEVAQPA